MLGPTLLKAKLGVDEVVTTLLLNFVVLLFVQMMLEGPLKDPMGGGWPQSDPILDAGLLPPLVERMRLHAGLVLGIVAALASLYVFIAAHRPRPADPRRRRQRGRRPLRRHAVTGVMITVGLSVGSARRACRRLGGRGAQGLSDGRSFPGVWLRGHRGRNARRAAAAPRRPGRDLRRGRLRREPTP